MKFLPLIWAGLWCQPGRALLTQLSILAAFFLFGLLQRLDVAFTHGVDAAGLDVLHVQPRYRGLLPLSDQGQISRLPGVAAITGRAGFDGYFREPANAISGLAVEPEAYFAVHRDYRIPAAQLHALQITRLGAAATAAAAAAYGWRIGDSIILHSKVANRDGSYDWPLVVVAIFTAPESTGLKGVLLNYSYLDAARTQENGSVDQFLVRISRPEESAAIAKRIDHLFENSGAATRTTNEKELAQAVLHQFGDLQFFTIAIVTAVFFTLLVLTVSTTLQSVRERIPEFSVLKTVGYSDRLVLLLVLAEATLLCLLPALLGLAATVGLLGLLMHYVGSLFGIATMPTIVIIQGIVLALLIALASGLPPAWRMTRLNIVDAIAGR